MPIIDKPLLLLVKALNELDIDYVIVGAISVIIYVSQIDKLTYDINLQDQYLNYFQIIF